MGTHCRVIGIVALVMACVAPGWAAEPVSIEKGRDVGDGVVAYDIPYDPQAVDRVLFLSPTVAHPYYEIVVPLGDWNDGANANVSAVRVNGVRYMSYYVFVDGVSHVQSAWVTSGEESAKNVVVVVRALWHNGENTTIEVDVTGKEPATVTRSFSAAAPSSGGGPEGWRRYQSFVVEETAGLARGKEPIEFTLADRSANCGDLDRELRLFAVNPDTRELESVDVQTYNPGEFAGQPPGTDRDYYLSAPSRSIEAVFLCSVGPNESRVFVACYDNPDATPRADAQTDLVVEGPDLGATVQNEFYTCKLSQESGQIAAFQLKGERSTPLLTNTYMDALHWNPDSFGDNQKWGHTFAWNPPDNTVVTTRGPILFRITNSGRMPDETPQVHASVTYSFYAGTPYVKCSTVTEVTDTFNASAIRNGELVVDTYLVDHWVWQEKNGQLKTVRTVHGPNWQDEWTYAVDPDVNWIAMTNEMDDYGVGSIVLASESFNPRTGTPTTHRQAYYLYYHHFWGHPLTYFTRGLVYPFSDYQRGPIIVATPQSTYIERCAFMPFYLTDADRYGAIERASKALHIPLRVRWGA